MLRADAAAVGCPILWSSACCIDGRRTRSASSVVAGPADASDESRFGAVLKGGIVSWYMRVLGRTLHSLPLLAPDTGRPECSHIQDNGLRSETVEGKEEAMQSLAPLVSLLWASSSFHSIPHGIVPGLWA